MVFSLKVSDHGSQFEVYGLAGGGRHQTNKRFEYVVEKIMFR